MLEFLLSVRGTIVSISINITISVTYYYSLISFCKVGFYQSLKFPYYSIEFLFR